MRQTHSIRKLAKMPVCLVMDILGKGNSRWIELVPFAPDGEEGFRRWLKGRKSTPERAEEYYRLNVYKHMDTAKMLRKTAAMAERSDAETDDWIEHALQQQHLMN